MDRKEQAAAVLTILREYYPDTDTTLNYRENPWRLLVGAILAAQCTDARVNQVTPALFDKYPEVRDFAAATPEEIEPYVRSCGLFRNKSRNIQAAAVHLLERHGGEVPSTEEELLAVPGVGRKIANLILGDSFGIQAIVVDTHCARISGLIGLTGSKQPLKVERDLETAVPHDGWTDWGHLMVTLGRDICIARRPQCHRCPVRPYCDYGSAALREDEARDVQMPGEED